MTQYCTTTSDERNVATLTITNDRRANVLGSDVMDALIDSLHQLSRDPSIRALVLASSGERSFIGGADLGEMASLRASEAETFIRRLKTVCEAIREFSAPVIARVHGWCIGGGLELAASCDIRVASIDAKFAMPEVRMGIPSVIHAALLPRLIGRGRASWLMLTADTIDASRALEWGLVDKVVDASGLDAAVEDVISMLNQSSVRVLRAQKALLNLWDELALKEAVEASVADFRGSFESGEPNQTMTAYLASRRKPPEQC